MIYKKGSIDDAIDKLSSIDYLIVSYLCQVSTSRVILFYSANSSSLKYKKFFITT